MQYSDYKCFRLAFDSGVAFVSIDHPPINLLDDVLSQELDQLGRQLEVDESVRAAMSLTHLSGFGSAAHPPGGIDRPDRLEEDENDRTVAVDRADLPPRR